MGLLLSDLRCGAGGGARPVRRQAAERRQASQ
jgi:hypothetical protein